MSSSWKQARQIKLKGLQQVRHILLTLRDGLQVRTTFQTKSRDKRSKSWTFIWLSATNFLEAMPLISYTHLLPKISTVCVILDIGLWFFLGETIQIISYSNNVTPSATILANLFSCVKRNSDCFETKIARLNSGSSILPIVKGSTLLTAATSTGK